MKIELNIPERLSDITLEQYQKFMDVYDKNPDNELFLRQKMLQIFCGLPLDQADRIKQKDFQEITDHLLAVLAHKPELVKQFTLDGVEYGFIPNMDDMSLGEFIDCDTAIGDRIKLQQLMSVLYRPIKHKDSRDRYLIHSYPGEVNPAFNRIPLDAVLSSMVFFWSLGNELLTSIQSSLEGAMKEVRTNPRLLQLLNNHSVLNGDGTSLSMSLPKETIYGIRKLLAQVFILPYYISPSLKTNNKQSKSRSKQKQKDNEGVL